MKVVTLGFSVVSPFPDLPLKNLLEAMEARSGQPDNTFDIERRLYVDSSHADFWTGLVVTVRDQKSFCKMENSKGEFVVSVENLKDAEKVMEFNFFVIHKKSGAGLYQQYHQSCSVGRFFDYLQARAKPLVATYAKERVKKEEKNKKLDEDEAEKRERKYRRRFSFVRMCTKERLDELLNQYKRVSAFEYEVATVVPDQHPSGAVPLAKLSRVVRHKFSFTRQASIDAVVSAVMTAVSNEKPKKGQAFVTDADGGHHTLRIFDMPEYFSEEEYDSVAEKLHNMNLKEFYKCKIVGAMMNTCTSSANRHLFVK